MTVLIAGGGIAGLTLGLTLHQIGVSFRVFEAVRDMKPLGVGINLQPTAVRELIELGLEELLDDVGIPTRDYGFYTRTGLEIWTEPRGVTAGYRWPQYSVHRGRLQMGLLKALTARAGADTFCAGHKLCGYEKSDDGVSARFATADGQTTADGPVLIGADGIHSAARALIHPAEGPPVWSGAVLWRGVTMAPPFLSGASMILAGNDHQRIVAYPLTPPDPQDGLAEINWIAEQRFDPAEPWRREDWNRRVDVSGILPAFEGWRFDWLDVPALIRNAAAVYEYPMVDRDPVDRWSDGPVTLIGDAAHPTYPVGSNGASQAIVDARILGAEILAAGAGPAALAAYEARVRPGVNKAVLTNRGNGPDAIMQMVEDRCGGDFSRMDTVISEAEKRAHADRYKALAGLSIADLNARAPLIAL